MGGIGVAPSNRALVLVRTGPLSMHNELGGTLGNHAANWHAQRHAWPRGHTLAEPSRNAVTLFTACQSVLGQLAVVMFVEHWGAQRASRGGDSM